MLDPDDEDNPLNEFFKRFGGPNGPGLNIQPQRPMPSRGVGSGFIVSPDGYIVTNAHVVDGAKEVTVRLTDRREFTAKVIGADKRTDIALIKIDAKSNLPALDLVEPARAAAGRMGRLRSDRRSASRTACRPGIVSGVHRALPGGQMTPFIQTDVAVNPGNSGGPLLNAAGQVVGVNSQIYSRSGGYMGLSFAIPADVAANVAQQLKDARQGEPRPPWHRHPGARTSRSRRASICPIRTARSSAPSKRTARPRRRASRPVT